MFFFPLINIVFLVILYRIHRGVFWVTLIVDIIVCGGGMYWVYDTFERLDNHILYTFAITGAGFIIAFIAFFIAIFLNHHRQK